MVGIRAGATYDINGFIHGEAFLSGEDTDQLRDNHSRMGIVDLDCRVLIQLVQITASCQRLIDDELCRIADHKILLVYTQDASLVIRIVRV